MISDSKQQCHRVGRSGTKWDGADVQTNCVQHNATNHEGQQEESNFDETKGVKVVKIVASTAR